MSRTYKPFSGPFAPMLTEFLAQKRALGYQYLSGYWVFRKFDSFSMDYDVVDYALTKEIVEAWGQKQPNESDVHWTNRILYVQQFSEFLVGQGYSGYITKAHKSSRSQFKAYVFTHEEMKKSSLRLTQWIFLHAPPTSICRFRCFTGCYMAAVSASQNY